MLRRQIKLIQCSLVGGTIYYWLPILWRSEAMQKDYLECVWYCYQTL